MAAPGTKLIEKDISQTTSPQSSNNIGIYGRSQKGRIDELITLTSDSDVPNLLGEENRSLYGFGVAGAKIALEGTNQVLFARATADDTKFASFSINASSDPVEEGTGFSKTQFRSETFIQPEDTATIACVVSDWCGVFSNQTSVMFSNWDPAYKTFDVNVYTHDNEGNLVDTGESFLSCSFENGGFDGYGNSTFIEDKINLKSDYIRVKVNPNAKSLTPDSALFGTVYTLAGGSDGGTLTPQNYLDAINLFNDPLTSTVGIIPDIGDATESSAPIQQALVTISQNRFKDDGAQFQVVMTAPKTLKDPNQLVTWSSTILNINSSFASLFAPWLKSIDARTNANIEIPSSLLVAKMLASASLGKSILGLNRGMISSKNYTILGPTVNFNKTQQGILYDSNINPIITYPGVGCVIWGQKTRQLRSSALDRLNVRRTADYIEYNLMNIARQYIGENNDEETRTSIYNECLQVGTDASSKGAIQEFAIKCDSENNTASIIDQNKLIVYFAFKPSKTIEWVEVTTIITKQDAVLSEVLN